MGWSHRVESWSGLWSGIYSVIVALRGQKLVLIHQFLVNNNFYETLSFYCHESLTYVNQDLNICFIINSQV